MLPVYTMSNIGDMWWCNYSWTFRKCRGCDRGDALRFGIKSDFRWSHWRHDHSSHAWSCRMTLRICFWLVVGPPLWKIWKSIGMMTFPIYGKIKFMATKPPTSVWLIQVKNHPWDVVTDHQPAAKSWKSPLSPKAASTNFSKSSDCPGTVLRYFPSVIFHTESS